jgi:hypothetical protein
MNRRAFIAGSLLLPTVAMATHDSDSEWKWHAADHNNREEFWYRDAGGRGERYHGRVFEGFSLEFNGAAYTHRWILWPPPHRLTGPPMALNGWAISALAGMDVVNRVINASSPSIGPGKVLRFSDGGERLVTIGP